jgi:hypothetical protein
MNKFNKLGHFEELKLSNRNRYDMLADTITTEEL